MAVGIYKITEDFEKELSDYTGAPYVVTVDNQSNALFLALMYENVKGMDIEIPCRTYPSVPCEIIHAGAKVKFKPVEGTTIKGAYQLSPTKVWDSALSLLFGQASRSLHMASVLRYRQRAAAVQNLQCRLH